MAAPSGTGSHETFILIGGSGSLGAHLTTALATAGHRVVVVDQVLEAVLGRRLRRRRGQQRRRRPDEQGDGDAGGTGHP